MTSPLPSARDREAYSRVLSRHARRRCLPAAVRLRGGFRLHGSRTGGARPAGDRARGRMASIAVVGAGLTGLDRRLPTEAAGKPGRGVRGERQDRRLDQDRAAGRLSRRAGARARWRRPSDRGGRSAHRSRSRLLEARRRADAPEPLHRAPRTAGAASDVARRAAHLPAAVQWRQAGHLRRATGRVGRLSARGKCGGLRPPSLQPGSAGLHRQSLRRGTFRRRSGAAVGAPRHAASCTRWSAPTGR